jgi:pilus assembly protein CpaE
MADRIKVLIVDDIADTREHLAKLVGFEDDIDVVGTAASGAEALHIAANLAPDLVLMDINMPEMDGIATTEALAKLAPRTAVVMMSVQGEAEYLRRSMLAGAREFLVKPFSTDELTTSIRQVYTREQEKQRLAGPSIAAPSALAPMQGTETGTPAAAPPTGNAGDHLPATVEPGLIVAIFGPKGGVGRTTIAVNVGIASKVTLGRRTVIVDGSFQFGDVGVLMNLNPKNQTIADMLPELEGADPERLGHFVIPHSSGLGVLLAPPSPEMAELVTPGAVKQILAALRSQYDLVIIDCPSSFNDTTLAMLDSADLILAVMTLELTSVKNIRLFLHVADQLGYPPAKIQLVLNRADSSLGIKVADVEQSIRRKIDHTIVSDGRNVVTALNRGVPLLVGNKGAAVSRDIRRLATSLVPKEAVAKAGAQRVGARKSLFARR